MKEEDSNSERDQNKWLDQLIHYHLLLSYVVVGLFFITFFVLLDLPPLKIFEAEQKPVIAEMDLEIVDGKHVETGLLAGEGIELVISTCTKCHSASLITQNRATREGWEGMLRWMQETQGLWDLGENEAPILDYLATHYAPEEQGRRAPLSDIEWYRLDP